MRLPTDPQPPGLLLLQQHRSDEEFGFDGTATDDFDTPAPAVRSPAWPLSPSVPPARNNVSTGSTNVQGFAGATSTDDDAETFQGFSAAALDDSDHATSEADVFEPLPEPTSPPLSAMVHKATPSCTHFAHPRAVWQADRLETCCRWPRRPTVASSSLLRGSRRPPAAAASVAA